TIPQTHKSAVFAVPSRPKRTEVATDTANDTTKSMKKTTVAPFADQKVVQQSITEQPETAPDIREQERLAVRRRQAAKRHTNRISYRAYHDMGRPMTFHSSEEPGITAREAANRQRQRIVREQQNAFNEADKEHAMPRRWGGIGNAALTGSRTASRVTEVPVVAENPTTSEAVPRARAIEDESMPSVIQDWLRGVWNEDERGPNTPEEIQAVTPLPPLAPVVRRQPTTVLNAEEMEVQLAAAHSAQMVPVHSTEESVSNDVDVPDWLRYLEPSTEKPILVDADEEPSVPVLSAYAALPPLPSTSVVSSTPVMATPIAARTPENIRQGYEVVFEEAAQLVAQQEVSFTGGGVGRVESFIRWSTRWMGRAGDFVYNGICGYGASNRARAERADALESLQTELIAYASSEEADYGDQLDLVQAEQIHFSERVLELKEAEAQRNRQRGGWHAIMSNKYIVTVGM